MLIDIPQPRPYGRDLEVQALIDYLDQPSKILSWEDLTPADIKLIDEEMRRCRADFRYTARNYYWITTKDRGDVLLTLFDAQELIYEEYLRLKLQGIPQRILCVKSRQLGCSTLLEGMICWRTTLFYNVESLVVSYDEDHAAYLFGIMQHIYDRLPWWMQPMIASRQFKDGLWFENPDQQARRFNPGLNSRISVFGANKGAGGIGQGRPISAAHLCLAASTPIHLSDGTVKPISEVAAGDRVLTSRGRIAPVLNVEKSSRHHEVSSQIWLWGNFAPLRTTRDHPVLTPAGFRPASELHSCDYVSMPVRPITDTQKEVVMMAQPSGGSHTGKGKRYAPRRFPCTYDTGWLFGLYLAEGTVNTHPRDRIKRASNPEFAFSSVLISIHRKEEDKVCAAIRRALGENVHLKPYRHSSLTSVIRISRSYLARFIAKHFGCTDRKRVPEWVWDCGEEFCRGLVAGYIEGDGHLTHDQTNAVYATSIRLAITMQMRALVASLGYGWSSISFKKGGEYYGRNCRDAWIWCISGDTASRLCRANGWEETERIRGNHHWRYSPDGRFVEIQVSESGDGFEEEFWDLEVDAPEHDFCTIHCCVKNSEFPSWKPESIARKVIDEDFGHALADNPEVFAFLEGTGKGAGKYAHHLWKRNEELGERARWHTLFLPSFLDKSHFIAPPGGWTPKEEEQALNQRVEREWLRCDGIGCGQHHRRRFRGSDRTGKACPTCKTGSLREYSLADGYMYWMQNLRENAVDEDAKRRLHQEQCVAGDTLISTERGMVPISQAGEIGSVETGAVAKWIPQGRQPVLRLRTELGRELVATEDHRISLADGTWRELSALQPGDRINLSPPRFPEKQAVVRWAHSPKVQMEMRVDATLGRFLGYYMGDGCTTGHMVRFTLGIEDRDVAEDIARVCMEVIGHEARIAPVRTWQVVESHDARWKEILGAIGGTKLNSQRNTIRKVCVPKAILESPKEVVREFLSALFECDGCAYPYSERIVFFTKYPEFARNLQLLLLGFGINSVVKEMVKKAGSGAEYPGCELRINRAGAYRFHREIGFIGARKRANAADAEEQCRYKVHRRFLTSGMEDAVASVEPAGEAEVFDISVPGPESFGANGILVHNCVTPSQAFAQSGKGAWTDEVLAWVDSRIQDPLPGGMGFLDLHLRFHAPNPEDGTCSVQECGSDHRLREEDQRFWIWEFPIPGEEYVVSVDVSSGMGGGCDYHCVWVTRKGKGHSNHAQVARFRCNDITGGELAVVAVRAARWYNMAVLAIESNAYTSCSEDAQRKLNYPNLYVRFAKDTVTRQQVKRFHWRTDVKTRPDLFDVGRQYLKAKRFDIVSRNCLEEMKTCTIEDQSTGRAEHEKLFKDDELIAGLIGLYVIHEQLIDPSQGYTAVPHELTRDNAPWLMVCAACGHEEPVEDAMAYEHCAACRSVHVQGHMNRAQDQIRDNTPMEMSEFQSQKPEERSFDAL